MGMRAGVYNKTGNDNISFGRCTSKCLDDAVGNIVIGCTAGCTLNSGDSNVLVGRGAGRNMSEGSNNLLAGTSAGYGLTSGNYNIFLGYWDAAYATGGSTPVASFVFDKAVVEVNNRWVKEVDITPFTFTPEEYIKVWDDDRKTDGSQQISKAKAKRTR